MKTQSFKFPLLLICSAIIFSIYIPNNGGAGLNIPYNSLALLLCALMLLLWQSSFAQQARLNPALNWYLTGSILLTLPLLWSGGDWRESGALHHIMVIWLALWGYILLCQVHFSEAVRRRCLQWVFVLAFLQAAIGAIQIFLPQLALRWFEYDWVANAGRPFGIFQQVNLLGSFLATGIGCGIWLYLTAQKSNKAVIYIAGVLVCSFTLAFTQSRTGIMGAALVILLNSIFIERNSEQSRRFINVVIGLFFVMLIVAVVSHEMGRIVINSTAFDYHSIKRDYGNSNTQRVSVLHNIMLMILQRPITGWGYGSFEHQFLLFSREHSPFLGMERIAHPHNEFLYTWMEGGIIAAVGLICLLAGWLRQICRLTGEQLTVALFPLPLLLHTQLEYPFYQSLLHLMVFILLLRLGWTDTERRPVSYVNRRPAVLLLAAGCLLMGFFSLKAGSELTRYERVGFLDMPTQLPWYIKTQGSRYEFDVMVGMLIRYNASRDPALLAEFSRRAENYLTYHYDKKLLASLSLIRRSHINAK